MFSTLLDEEEEELEPREKKVYSPHEPPTVGLNTPNSVPVRQNKARMEFSTPLSSPMVLGNTQEHLEYQSGSFLDDLDEKFFNLAERLSSLKAFQLQAIK